MEQRNSTEADVTELIEQVRQATAAYINGDIRRYLTLIEHAEDYTLMAPLYVKALC